MLTATESQSAPRSHGEFRPIVIDSVVLTCINKRIIQQDDFHVELGEHTGSAPMPVGASSCSMKSARTLGSSIPSLVTA
jgi:hypothetical protein